MSTPAIEADAFLSLLSRTIDVARAKGVRVVKCSMFEVELGPPVDNTPATKPGPDPDICRCGHPTHAHGAGGFCIHGCAASACVDPKLVEALEREEKST